MFRRWRGLPIQIVVVGSVMRGRGFVVTLVAEERRQTSAWDLVERVRRGAGDELWRLEAEEDEEEDDICNANDVK
jgi:hypothetical protein